MDNEKSNKPQSALSLSLWHTWVTSKSRNITVISELLFLDDVRSFSQRALHCLELIGCYCVRTFYFGPRGSLGESGVD